MNIFDIIPPTFIIDFGSDDIEKDINNFLKFFH
jgi:hypothetical protein